ncbi:MAG TPA: metal-sensitive transcriptional regulator [Candidatus Dormibacteraeota bacterium]|jgi:DNA-binding FrmR family transcriptional regulator|nr:metal-sensitive transcriptional regulator [Candidatus Dormibacteraeota bacterium]
MPSPGYAGRKKAVLSRLARVEGQVRGVSRMVEDERYCIEVLTQVSAAKAALDRVALMLLEEHVGHCVSDAIRSGRGGEKVRELSDAIERLVRS